MFPRHRWCFLLLIAAGIFVGNVCCRAPYRGARSPIWQHIVGPGDAVVVEAGLYSASEMAAWKAEHNRRDVVIFGFEPLSRDTYVPGQAAAQMHVLPVAVGDCPSGKTTLLPLEYCATMPGSWKRKSAEDEAKLNDKLKGHTRFCSYNATRRVKPKTVPCTTLEAFIEDMALPTIDFLKVDTQGNELEIILSAGRFLPRVQRLMLELQDVPEDHWARMYRALNVSALSQRLRPLGFVLECCVMNNPDLRELDCFYRQNDVKWGDWPYVGPPWKYTPVVSDDPFLTYDIPFCHDPYSPVPYFQKVKLTC